MEQNRKDGNLILTFLAMCALLLIFFQSCRISRVSDTHDGGVTNNVPEIIFLNYMVRAGKDKEGIEVELIDKTITTGKLKTAAISVRDQRPGDLVCLSLDGMMHPTDSLPVPDPLNISVESVGDNSMLYRKEIALDSAVFTVRIQLKPDTKAIALRKKAAGKSNSYLIVTNITEP